MFFDDNNSTKQDTIQPVAEEQTVAAGIEPATGKFATEVKSAAVTHNSTTRDQVIFEKLPDAEAPASELTTPRASRFNRRWRVLATSIALLFIILTGAGIYLLTKQPSTVDNIVITTVPSGADVTLNSNRYGLSPIKLEQLEKGVYTLTINKDGFEPVVEQINLSESGHQFEYKLRPLPPPEVAGLSVEDQIKSHQNKLEETLARGHYGIPYENSAHYYAQLILMLDQNNEYATSKLEEIQAIAQRAARESIARGDLAQAQEINRFIRNYYGPSQDTAKRSGQYASATPETKDPVESGSNPSDIERLNQQNADFRREQGLAKYRNGQYPEAIPDLQFALTNGRSTTEVIFSLADSYKRTRQYDSAEYYFNQVPVSGDASYRSAIAALGDIASIRGDAATALERYRQARQLGGSTLYTIEMLDDKIGRIEQRQREKADEPVPFTAQARHQHGSLRGSCQGTLSVSSTGVRYDGSEHQFSWNLLSVAVRVESDGLRISAQGKTEKFKVDRSSAERFRETVSRYQQPYTPGN